MEDNFIGIQLTKTTRLKTSYELQTLKKAKTTDNYSWETTAYKSNPFKLIPSVHEKLLNLKSQMEDKIGSLKTYYIKVSDKVSFSKVDHQSQWYVKTNCYPLGLGLTLWNCIEDLLELDRAVLVEEYELLVDEACKTILRAEISDKIPLKSKVENADNSITEEEE